jgi:hypothetical protein
LDTANITGKAIIDTQVIKYPRDITVIKTAINLIIMNITVIKSTTDLTVIKTVIDNR